MHLRSKLVKILVFNVKIDQNLVLMLKFVKIMAYKVNIYQYFGL